MADTPALGAGARKSVGVRVPPPALFSLSLGSVRPRAARLQPPTRQCGMMGRWPSVIVPNVGARSSKHPPSRRPRSPATARQRRHPSIPDDLEPTPAETLAYAQDLLERGLAFNAHEVLEAAWTNGPTTRRRCRQPGAFAVGITPVLRGSQGRDDRAPARASGRSCRRRGGGTVASTWRSGRLCRRAD